MVLWTELYLPKIYTLKSSPPVPQKETVLGDRVLKEVLS